MWDDKKLLKQYRKLRLFYEIREVVVVFSTKKNKQKYHKKS